jgi:hypothetical protein
MGFRKELGVVHRERWKDNDKVRNGGSRLEQGLSFIKIVKDITKNRR